MSTAQPVAFAGTFQVAADQSLPQDGIPFNFSGTYLALVADLMNVPGAGAIAVPFGSVGAPGAKGLLIRYDAQAAPAAAVLLRLNGGVTDIELTPGSLFIYFNAAPAAGLTAALLTFTAACQIRVWVLG
jgi:hypothetical protein